MTSRSLGRTRWTKLQQQPGDFNYLRNLRHTRDELKNQGYRVAQFTDEELWERLKCETCGKKVNMTVTPKMSNSTPNQASACTYHSGKIVDDSFCCCGSLSFTKGDRGCCSAPAHLVSANPLGHLRSYWAFAFTPRPHLRPKRAAVAIDGEFGINKYGDYELIRISAVDFFTQEVLLDSLVYPQTEVINYNSNYSGVREADINRARRGGQCLLGRDAAREQLLQHLDSRTLVIVHGGSGDLRALRLIHPSIIDTKLFDEKFQAVEGGRSLRNLCSARLRRQIQTGDHGHDSLEDALATRELLLWMLRNLRNKDVRLTQ